MCLAGLRYGEPGDGAMGFHVVIDKDDLREGVQLTVDVS